MAKVSVILLESIRGIGKAGEIVEVAAGYFRNFLSKSQKARYATEENIQALAEERRILEERDLRRKEEAQILAEKLENFLISVSRESSEMGILYGSVSVSDIVKLLSDKGFQIFKSAVILKEPIKSLGEYVIPLELHPEVSCNIKLEISRK